MGAIESLLTSILSTLKDILKYTGPTTHTQILTYKATSTTAIQTLYDPVPKDVVSWGFTNDATTSNVYVWFNQTSAVPDNRLTITPGSRWTFDTYVPMIYFSFASSDSTGQVTLDAYSP